MGDCVASAPVTEPSPADPSPGPRRAPTPLLVAAALVAVEAALLIVYGMAEIGAVSGERLAMGLTTTLFFWMYGGGLAFAAWALARTVSWARAPVVLAQLIQLLVAWSFLGGDTTPVGVALIVAAVTVLVGIFHPASIATMGEEPGGD